MLKFVPTFYLSLCSGSYPSETSRSSCCGRVCGATDCHSGTSSLPDCQTEEEDGTEGQHAQEELLPLRQHRLLRLQKVSRFTEVNSENKNLEHFFFKNRLVLLI